MPGASAALDCSPRSPGQKRMNLHAVPDELAANAIEALLVLGALNADARQVRRFSLLSRVPPRQKTHGHARWDAAGAGCRGRQGYSHIPSALDF